MPYNEWVKEHVIHLSEITQADESDIPKVEDLFQKQQAFGYTQEDLVRMIVPMAKDGKDPVGAMGADAPLASSLINHNCYTATSSKCSHK
ncbi:Ferredoxin-dependent glutamate synthase 1 [Veillonella atypica]|nr:Ferredoxin-dependent glutamate synthase 1 [Veillonella atypica]